MGITDLTRRGFLMGAAASAFAATAASPLSLLNSIAPPAVKAAPSATQVSTAYRWLVEHLTHALHDGQGLFPAQIHTHLETLSAHLADIRHLSAFDHIMPAVKELGDDWVPCDFLSHAEDVAGYVLDMIGDECVFLGEASPSATFFEMRRDAYLQGHVQYRAAASEMVEEATQPVPEVTFVEEQQGVLSMTQRAFSTVSAILDEVEEIADTKKEPVEAPLPVLEDRHLGL